MKFFKKLFSKFKKKEKAKEPDTWYNNLSNDYDPKIGTPNGEAYISPDSVVIGISKNH